MSRDHNDLTQNRAVPSAPVSFASQADADERRFEQPEAELVAVIRAGIEAHKAREQGRNLAWIKRCQRMLAAQEEADAGAT